MQTILGNRVVYNFSNEMEAVAEVKNGEVVKVQTNDCFFQQIKAESQIVESIDLERINPATGPIFVADAEPGDILKIKILDIQVADQGVSLISPGSGFLGEENKTALTRIIPIEDGLVSFLGKKIPIDPMIGVIGVATAEGEGTYPTATPWKHGGNMDTTDIRAGSTLYLPVGQTGAMLALGDCHGIMGDGEICYTGLEIAATVTLDISVIKNKKLNWPLVETPKSTLIIASGETIEAALRTASQESVKILAKSLGITWEDAYILAGITMDLKISQLVNPQKTARASIPKEILATADLIEKL